MVLNASYVCLLHSRFIENHAIWILEDGPLISRGFCHNVVIADQRSSNHSSTSTKSTHTRATRASEFSREAAVARVLRGGVYGVCVWRPQPRPFFYRAC
jgi:hypothetical protein